MSDETEERDGAVALMASIAGAMAADAHHSTRQIEGHLSSRIVEMYDDMKRIHARLGDAMESGNLFKLVDVYADLSEALAEARIGLAHTRKVSEGWAG